MTCLTCRVTPPSDHTACALIAALTEVKDHVMWHTIGYEYRSAVPFLFHIQKLCECTTAHARLKSYGCKSSKTQALEFAIPVTHLHLGCTGDYVPIEAVTHATYISSGARAIALRFCSMLCE